MNINKKSIINQKFEIAFQITQPKNIAYKYFCTQNGPLDIWFQMRLKPNHVGFFFIFGNFKQKQQHNILNCFKKIPPWVLPNFSRSKKPNCFGSVSFKPDIKKYVLGAEIFDHNFDFFIHPYFQFIFIYFQKHGTKSN